MHNSDNNADNNRRNFLKLGALGAAAAACGSAVCSCGKKEESSTGDKVKLLSPEGELVEVDKKELRPVHNHKVAISHEEARMGIPGRKFVMVIDLARCKNARKCVTSCQKMHNLKEDQELLKVKLLQDTPESSPYWFPKVCFQCDNPPCVKVCPVDATFKSADGVVLIDNQRCIGCKFCMAACPYSTRVFNWAEFADPEPVMCSPEFSIPREVGTVEKCDFCAYQAREGNLPDCVTACPNGVFYYGDQNDDTVSNGEEVVRFSQLIKDRAGYRFMEELGTEPRVWYLPPVDRIFPVERGLDGLPDDIRDRFKDIM